MKNLKSIFKKNYFIINEKLNEIVKCYDPMAMENTKKLFPDLTYCPDEYETAKDSDALVVLTEWNQFRKSDIK